MTSLNIVGPKVKELRLTCSPSLTQEALASKLQILGWDIDRFGVSKIERGQRQVTDREVLMLAKALGVSLSSRYGNVTHRKSCSDEIYPGFAG